LLAGPARIPEFAPLGVIGNHSVGDALAVRRPPGFIFSA
jgi:hypothetical protein